MLNLSVSRYFDVKIGGKHIQVKPPKLKILKEMSNISRELSGNDAGNNLEYLTGLTRRVLSSNKKNETISTEFIEGNMTSDDLTLFVQEYFAWAGKIQKDPN